MKIIVNGMPQEVDATCLSDALEELGFQGRTVATAVNETFVAKVRRAQTELRDGDRLEVVAPMQGG